jgi:predicted O-linked N-acetylglucosamine transferase (SPINDLY family)
MERRGSGGLGSVPGQVFLSSTLYVPHDIDKYYSEQVLRLENAMVQTVFRQPNSDIISVKRPPESTILVSVPWGSKAKITLSTSTSTW